MSVKVIEKNAGEKIPFTESGYKLNFDDMLAIKCDKYQKDWPVHKDICMDADGDLTMGTGDGLFMLLRSIFRPESTSSRKRATRRAREKLRLQRSWT